MPSFRRIVRSRCQGRMLVRPTQNVGNCRCCHRSASSRTRNLGPSGRGNRGLLILAQPRPVHLMLGAFGRGLPTAAPVLRRPVRRTGCRVATGQLLSMNGRRLWTAGNGPPQQGQIWRGRPCGFSFRAPESGVRFARSVGCRRLSPQATPRVPDSPSHRAG